MFQDLDARAIAKDLRRLPAGRVPLRRAGRVAGAPITTQYRETDWAFVTRLLARPAWPGATRTRRTPTARPPRPRW
uniref:hypothetical protein n=1 Tax=Xanthomonas oryzae TaxID=347 RepID=UPI003DA08EB7